MYISEGIVYCLWMACSVFLKPLLDWKTFALQNVKCCVVMPLSMEIRALVLNHHLVLRGMVFLQLPWYIFLLWLTIT